MTLNDLNSHFTLHSVFFAQVRLELCVEFLKAIALQMLKVDPQCQQQKCLAWTLVSGDIKLIQKILAGSGSILAC